MRFRVVLAVTAVALLPAAVFAVPRPPEPLLHPRNVASVPTYVQRVEPAIVGLRVRVDERSPSAAALETGPEDTVPDDVRDKLRRAWDLISGKG